MHKFYLSGHKTFGNRGCEALVRTVCKSLHDEFGTVEVRVPSTDPIADHALWPTAHECGVKFVRAYDPFLGRLWAKLQNTFPALLGNVDWPLPFPRWFLNDLRDVDAVIAIGGDNYSLDYQLPTLIVAIDQAAMDMNIPVFLWAASVGPFRNRPRFVEYMAAHLRRMSGITVREPMSRDYAERELRCDDVQETADSAFILEPESVDATAFWPQHAGGGILGLNLSPIVSKKAENARWLNEYSEFVRHAVSRMGMGVLLVPHVIPRGTTFNDFTILQELSHDLADLGSRVCVVPPTLNSAQIKYLVSKTRIFFGARTHSTIAALSSGVPTITIAYSVKAYGINQQIFQSQELVVPMAGISTEKLKQALNYVLDREAALKQHLEAKLPEIQARAKSTSGLLRRVLNDGPI